MPSVVPGNTGAHVQNQTGAHTVALCAHLLPTLPPCYFTPPLPSPLVTMGPWQTSVEQPGPGTIWGPGGSPLEAPGEGWWKGCLQSL